MNKPNTLLLAEKEADTDCIAWLDSDILVLDEPGQMALAADEAFAACGPDKNVGTSEPLTNPLSGLGRLQLKVLKTIRSWQFQKYLTTCHAY